MKKHINLLSNRQQRESLYKKITQIQQASTLIGVAFFIIFLFFTYLSLQQQHVKNSLTQEKARLLGEIMLQNNSTAKTVYFFEKKQQVNTFLKDDAKFLPYYNLLNSVINQASPSPIIQSMNIDKQKNTDFTMQFTDFNSAYDFLRFVESDKFLNNFTSLTLTNFSVNSRNLSDKGYQLRFEGKFKNIDENRF